MSSKYLNTLLFPNFGLLGVVYTREWSTSNTSDYVLCMLLLISYKYTSRIATKITSNSLLFEVYINILKTLKCMQSILSDCNLYVTTDIQSLITY